MERLDGVDMSPHCQRCGSTNTKFCYYNNYSLTQPRYFCKGCRRYWTKGGSLRNVPVGGGCRKTRRGKAISLSRYHHHRSPSKSPLCNSSLDSSYVTGTSTSFGSLGSSLDAPSNIDLAAVYANFLNQDSKQEPEPAKNLPKDDSPTNPMPCFSTMKMGDPIMPSELPLLPDAEGLMFSKGADWFDSQLVGLNEDPSVHILSDKFSQEIHDINLVIDNWNSFDFSI